jgi:predicted aldo/keto reductase-like oxidoreductase
MYAEGYKSAELAQSTYDEIPSAFSASACLDCSICVARCANGLNIPMKMAKARKLLA